MSIEQTQSPTNVDPIIPVNQIFNSLSSFIENRFGFAEAEINNTYFLAPYLIRTTHPKARDAVSGDVVPRQDQVHLVFERRDRGNPFTLEFKGDMTESQFAEQLNYVAEFTERVYAHRVPLVTNVSVAPNIPEEIASRLRMNVIVPAARRFEREHFMSLNFIIFNEDNSGSEVETQNYVIDVTDTWGVNHPICKITLGDVSQEADDCVLVDKLHNGVLGALDEIKRKDERYYNLYSFSEQYDPTLLDVLLEEQKQTQLANNSAE